MKKETQAVVVARVDEVQGWPLAVVRGGDGKEQPLVGHRVAAKKLGYGDPDGLLVLARRVFEGKVISSIPYRENRTGGRGRPEREYLFSRHQLIRLAMRCENPEADPIQEEIATVFGAWLDARNPTASTHPDVWAKALTAQLNQLVENSERRTLSFLATELDTRLEGLDARVDARIDAKLAALSTKIDEAQAADLKDLIDRVVNERGLSFGKAEGLLRSKLGVGSYRNIRVSDLDKAVEILQIQLEAEPAVPKTWTLRERPDAVPIGEVKDRLADAFPSFERSVGAVKKLATRLGMHVHKEVTTSPGGVVKNSQFYVLPEDVRAMRDHLRTQKGDSRAWN